MSKDFNAWGQSRWDALQNYGAKPVFILLYLQFQREEKKRDLVECEANMQRMQLRLKVCTPDLYLYLHFLYSKHH